MTTLHTILLTKVNAKTGRVYTIRHVTTQYDQALDIYNSATTNNKKWFTYSEQSKQYRLLYSFKTTPTGCFSQRPSLAVS